MDEYDKFAEALDEMMGASDGNSWREKANLALMACDQTHLGEFLAWLTVTDDGIVVAD